MSRTPVLQTLTYIREVQILSSKPLPFRSCGTQCKLLPTKLPKNSINEKILENPLWTAQNDTPINRYNRLILTLYDASDLGPELFQYLRQWKLLSASFFETLETPVMTCLPLDFNIVDIKASEIPVRRGSTPSSALPYR